MFYLCFLFVLFIFFRFLLCFYSFEFSFKAVICGLLFNYGQQYRIIIYAEF